MTGIDDDHDEFAATAPIGRRRALAVFGSIGATLITARIAGATTRASTPSTSTGACEITPTETGGPFPADGSSMGGSAAAGSDNGAAYNVLADPGFVRVDMRSNIDGSDTQDGVPLTLTVNVMSAADGCTPLAGAAVYVWHCSVDGHYSGYAGGMNGGDYSGASWLRAIQIADDSGAATFQTVLPGRYQGRAFHIHYRIFSDSAYGTQLLTSQMALPDDTVTELYTAAGERYATALASVTTNAADGVFGDGVDHQLLTISGDVTAGLTAVCNATV